MCQKKNVATTALKHLQKSHLELPSTNSFILCTLTNITCHTLDNDKPQQTVGTTYDLLRVPSYQQLVFAQPHLDLYIFNVTTHHALLVRLRMHTCRSPDHSRNVYFITNATGEREHPPRVNSAQTRARR